MVLTFNLLLSPHPCPAQTPEKLVYEKKESRRATYEAALRSSGRPVFGPWSQVAPFDPILRRPQPPEETPHADEYPLHGGGKAGWRLEEDYLDGYANTLRLDRIPPDALKRQPTVCLKRTIATEEAQKLRVYLGCDGGFILWLNNRPLLYAGNLDELAPGQESVELPLLKGTNTLVLKISLSKTPCRFFFQPEFGKDFTDQLLARVEQDFPLDRKPLAGYRARAARRSSEVEDRYYRLVEIPSPPGVVIEGGGMDFLPDGKLAVSTRRGFVYTVENPGSDKTGWGPEEIKFHRFASGLHQPLGLRVIDGRVTVVNKGELTRLIDSNGDGTADRFENLNNQWGISGNYHEYAYGLVADEAGNLYIPLNCSFPKGGPASPVPYRGWVVRITPQGELEPFCYGFRSPNGIGKNAAGDIFVTDNQGEWIPACPLVHIQKDRFYGHPVSIRWTKDALAKGLVPDKNYRAQRKRTLPAVWFPYDELCQSATDVVCDTTGGQFGPFENQLFVGEMTKGLIARVQLEKVNGKYQGSCFLFRRGCGAVNRMTFGPGGRLYLARVNRGWGGGGLGEGLARLEFTGDRPLEIHSIHLTGRHGFELTFTRPLAEGAGVDPADYDLEQYRYHFWSTYGSPRIDLEKIEVRAVEVSPDRRRVKLTTSELKEEKVCRFALKNITAADGLPLLHTEAFYTLNEFPR